MMKHIGPSQLCAVRFWLRLASAAVVMFVGMVATVQADAERLAGRLQATIDGRTVNFPRLKSDIHALVSGDLATVTVTQRFANPHGAPVNATYLFPLNKDAAVNQMSLEVGEERIKAVVQRRVEAQETFATAASEGKSAALLEQHRPNMFTQSVANLMPGLPISVKLTYLQTVAKVDGRYEFVLPLVVGPRYIPADPVATNVETTHDDEPRAPNGQWESEPLPDYPPVEGLGVPATIDTGRVSIHVELDGAMPITDIASQTHTLLVETPNENRATVKLAEGATVDNRDFVLQYRLDADTAQAGFLSYKDERGGFFSLLIEPPAAVDDSSVSDREMVFLLDTSGSMAGLPMSASKTFMRESLRRLRPSDHFRIIRFSDSATEFSTAPLPATPDNVARGIRYTNELQGSGGTVMTSGIKQALSAQSLPGAVRIVVFLTDGYISNESGVLDLVHGYIGHARIFAFGIGSAVNRYLLSELGREGRGFTRYVLPGESAEEAAVELAERLRSPVLTDIEIDWGDLSVSDVYPPSIPDLFAGHSIRVQGRYQGSGKHQIKIKGRKRNQVAGMSLSVDLPVTSNGPDTIASIWARSAVSEFMRAMHRNPSQRAAYIEQITTLGLRYKLATRWTSFVAVSERIYNQNPNSTATLPVPLPRVDGVLPSAYPSEQQSMQPVRVATTAHQQPSSVSFSGGSTPEPGPMLGLAALAGLFSLFAARARREKRTAA